MTIADSNRDEIVIAAKVHGKMHEGPNGGGLSRKAILSEIDKSLKKGPPRTHVRCCVQIWEGMVTMSGSAVPEDLYPAQVNSSAFMKTPERTTAEVFPRYLGGEVVADSAALKWPGLFVRRYRFPRVVDGFLVPATAEPLIACTIAGSAEFEEREIGGAWLPHPVRRGDLFVTRSKTPYELRWNSPSGAELEVVHIHVSVDQLTTALEAVYGDKATDVEVTDFFGRDETLAHFCFACAELLSSWDCGQRETYRCLHASSGDPYRREIHERRIAEA